MMIDYNSSIIKLLLNFGIDISQMNCVEFNDFFKVGLVWFTGIVVLIILFVFVYKLTSLMMRFKL